MAPTPEQAKAKAAEAVTSAAEEKVAIFLKERLGNLAIIPEYNDIAIPEDNGQGNAEYRRMAGELITDREFTVNKKSGGTVNVSLAALDKYDKENGGKLLDALGIQSTEELVPTREQLDSISDAVGEGVKENVGPIKGASIGAAFKGFMNWLGGLFNGTSSFSWKSIEQAIANVVAGDMSESVKGKLNKLRENDPEMSRFLGDDDITNIGSTVRNRVLQEAGIEVPASGNAEPAEATTLENARPKSLDIDRMTIRKKVYDGMMNPENNDRGPVEAALADGMVKNKEETAHFLGINWGTFAGITGFVGITNTTGPVTEYRLRESAHKMSPHIATAVADTVSNPNYRTADGRKLTELSKEEFATALSDEVGKSLMKNEKHFDLPFPLDSKIDTIKQNIRNGILTPDEKGKTPYDQLATAANLAASAPIPEGTRQLADQAVDGTVRDATAQHGAIDMADGSSVPSSNTYKPLDGEYQKDLLNGR